MKMAFYLDEIRHACESIFPAVWAEQDAVEELEGQIAKLTTEMEFGYRQAEYLQRSEDPDDVMASAGQHWDTYFGSDKERCHAEAALPHKTQLRDVRAFACAAMSGAILQFAKQGISVVHKGLQNCPDGRLIYAVCLKSVIWEGRNQSLHWETGRPHSAVEKCFDSLKVAVPALSDYRTRNLAFDLVRMLGWRDYSVFKFDMMALA
jgi:hypothetical protein